MTTLLLTLELALAAPYAVVIGTDTPPPGRAGLRYARTDAEAVRDVLVDLGGFADHRVALLLDPTPDEVLAAVGAVPGDADTFLLYYSGHADTEVLFPAGRRLPIAALKDAVDAVPSPVRIGVVDACHGGGWTGTKGLTATAPFEVVSFASAGTAYIAASSGVEDAHELELLGGSVFTHHWVGGLRGPADADGDRIVTLGESFDWARARTIHDSTVLAGYTQHPSFHLDVRGRQDVALADLRGARSTVELRWTEGEVSVHALDSGVHVADLPGDRQPATLVLPPGSYVARRARGLRVDVAEFEVRAGTPARIDEAQFVTVGPVGAVAMKGDAPSEIDRMAPLARHWISHVAVGSVVGPAADGTLERGVAFRVGYSYGITDRLSLSFPLIGAGLRLGGPGGWEALAYGGSYEAGLMVLTGGEFDPGVYGTFGGGMDLRREIVPGAAFVSSSQVTTNVEWNRDLARADPSRIALGLGVEVHVGTRATLRPSVGNDHGFSDTGTVLSLGGALRRGTRPLPLLQLDLGQRTWLDFDYSLRFDTDRFNQPSQEAWIGISGVAGKSRADAR